VHDIKWLEGKTIKALPKLQLDMSVLCENAIAAYFAY